MPRSLRLAVVFVVFVVFVVSSSGSVGSSRPVAAEPMGYRPPVDGPVVSPFDLPPQPWMAGNRGIDYAPPPGTPVAAAADGEVAFAGPVAGALHVTVRHADGLRTTVSFLAEVTVAAGARVRQGQTLGLAGGPVHFGVRDPEGRYLDPALLLSGALVPGAVLVPGTAEGADPLLERRSLFSVMVGTGVAATTWAVSTGGRVGLAAVDVAARSTALGVVWEMTRECTSASTAVPSPDGRRIAVVVSGLGTGSGGNSAWEVPTGDLGYADADVVRFSYAGGRAPSPGAPPRSGATGLEGLAQSEFTAADSQQALETSAARLGALLADVAARAPGVPIDVIAHSQGGVVSRLAIAEAAAAGTIPVNLETLVTLGSPHGGAPLADLVLGLDGSVAGRVALDLASGAFPGLDPSAPAPGQLGTRSAVLRSVADQRLPETVRFTSIGARWDLTVPAGQTGDAAARHVIVDPGPGTDAHGAITSSPAAVREIGLAVAGRSPTCESFTDAGLDVAASRGIAAAETAAAVGAAVAAASDGHLP